MEFIKGIYEMLFMSIVFCLLKNTEVSISTDRFSSPLNQILSNMFSTASINIITTSMTLFHKFYQLFMVFPRKDGHCSASLTSVFSCTLFLYLSEICSVISDSLQLHRLHSPWNSPGQNTEVGSLSLPQGISSTQGSNPGLLHCRWILYQLSHKGSLQWSDFI